MSSKSLFVGVITYFTCTKKHLFETIRFGSIKQFRLRCKSWSRQVIEEESSIRYVQMSWLSEKMLFSNSKLQLWPWNNVKIYVKFIRKCSPVWRRINVSSNKDIFSIVKDWRHTTLRFVQITYISPCIILIFGDGGHWFWVFKKPSNNICSRVGRRSSIISYP